MKLAFIGASHWHLPLYLDPALEIDGVEIVGISDTDAACVKALSARLSCAGDTDFRALCRKTRPDFVVALGRHCDMVDEARFLLEEGIPFALEKPCGLNAGDATELAALAERTGTFAAVPLVFRNGDFTARLQEMSAKGIQYMSYRFIAGFPARSTRPPPLHSTCIMPCARTTDIWSRMIRRRSSWCAIPASGR